MVKKRIKKQTKKSNDQVKKKMLSYGVGAMLLLAVVALVLVGTTTGAAVTMKSYGVTEELISSKKGTIQSMLKLDKATLKSMSTVSGREKVASEIGKTWNLADSIVDLYQENPRVTISSLSYPGLDNGAKLAAMNFMKNPRCLRQIGIRNRGKPFTENLVVTELQYQACKIKLGWVYTYLKHSFYRMDGSYFCSQSDDMLFAINKENGEITTDTTNCQ